MIKIDYILSLRISGKNTGKEKATTEKITYLDKLAGLNYYTLDVISKNDKNKAIKMVILELYYIYDLIFKRKSKPDTIIARSVFSFGAYCIAKLYKIPIIFEVHADILDESKILFQNSDVKKFLSLLWHKYNLFFIKRADGLIFNNPLLEKHYNSHYLDSSIKTISIHNGSDTEFFYPIEKLQARKNISLKEEALYLLFIGSISKWHGVESLIEAYSHINKNCAGKQIILLIVGGHRKDYLVELKKKYSNSGIVFKGEVAKEEALQYINAADICMLPVNNIRISPGSPLKLFDYAACGKPIITQIDTVGYSDLVEKYNLGICCDFTDYRKAANIITDFIRSYDEVYYQNNNRKIAEEYFSWDKVLKRWLDFDLSIKMDIVSRKK
jgi:glycosyltransferase involved in cell wall biosynthesis